MRSVSFFTRRSDMTTFTYTDPSGKKLPIPPVNDGALYRYIRHILGDVDASRIIREAKKLGRIIRELIEAGDYEAVRLLVERINNAPAP
jgi:hypothetical protein